MSTTATTTPVNRRARRSLMTVGAVAAGLSVVVGGAGAAMAVAPTSAVSRAVAGALHEAGVDWSSMPAGYTKAQYEAFWGAGYSAADVARLSTLWKSDALETKAHAGQMILDGKTLPIAPTPESSAASSSQADRTLASTSSKDSPPGGEYDVSRCQSSHMPGGS